MKITLINCNQFKRTRQQNYFLTLFFTNFTVYLMQLEFWFSYARIGVSKKTWCHALHRKNTWFRRIITWDKKMSPFCDVRHREKALRSGVGSFCFTPVGGSEKRPFFSTATVLRLRLVSSVYLKSQEQKKCRNFREVCHWKNIWLIWFFFRLRKCVFVIWRFKKMWV